MPPERTASAVDASESAAAAVAHSTASHEPVDVVRAASMLFRELSTADDAERLVELARKLIETDPANLSLVIHTAVAEDSLGSLKVLNIDPATLVEYVSPSLLVNAGLVDPSTARRRNQRVLSAETRIMTHDVANEAPDAYARTLALASAPSLVCEQLQSSLDPKQESTTVKAAKVSLSPDIASSLLSETGSFALEPLRVLDTQIDALLALSGQFRAFSQAIRHFASHSPFRSHHDIVPLFTQRIRHAEHWKSAARATAILVVLKFLSFREVFAHIDPGPAGFKTFVTECEESRRESQAGTSALAMAMPLADDDDDDEEEEEGYDTPAPEGNKLATSEMVSEGAKSSNGVSASGDRKEQYGPPGHSRQEIERALYFIAALLRAVVDFEGDEMIEQEAMSIVSAYPLAVGESHELGEALGTLFVARSGDSRKSVVEAAQKYLAFVTHRLSRGAWMKFSTVAKAELEEGSRGEVLDSWLPVFREFMLPSLDTFSQDSGASRVGLLWEFDESMRYSLYSDLQMRVAAENPFVKARFAKAERDTKDILKRLTKADAATKIVPQLVAVFGECPLPSLGVFVTQVESYSIGHLVATADTEHAVPPLAMDMLPMVLLQQLTSGRAAQQSDGLYASRWFRLLAGFAADVASRYKTFDFVTLIMFVLREFSLNNFSHVDVLAQILWRLSGYPSTRNLSLPQLAALATAPPVDADVARAIAENFDEDATSRLLSRINDAGLTTTVITALGYAHRQLLIQGTDAKVTAARRDEVAELMLLYAGLISREESAHVDVKTLAESGLSLPYVAPVWRVDAAYNSGDLPPDLMPSANVSTELATIFWRSTLYDVHYDDAIYMALQGSRDPKTLEKASLKHKLHIKAVHQRLTGASSTLFADGATTSTEFANKLLLPRILLSPSDALFTSRFLWRLLEVNPAHFSFDEVVSAIFNRGPLLAVLNSSSPLQIESIGVFICDFFQTAIDKSESLSDYRGLHNSLKEVLLEAAYPGSAFIPLTNAFTLLQRIGPVFPMYREDGEAIEQRVHVLTLTQEDADLETAVKSLYAQISRRKSLWVPADTADFRSTEFTKSLIAHNERLILRLAAIVKASQQPTPSAEDEAKEGVGAGKTIRPTAKPRKRGSKEARREVDTSSRSQDMAAPDAVQKTVRSIPATSKSESGVSEARAGGGPSQKNNNNRNNANKAKESSDLRSFRDTRRDTRRDDRRDERRDDRRQDRRADRRVDRKEEGDLIDDRRGAHDRADTRRDTRTDSRGSVGRDDRRDDRWKDRKDARSDDRDSNRRDRPPKRRRN